MDGHRFTPFDAASAPWARSWGLATKMEDIRRVVARARAGGHRVVLGGLSFGGYETVAYAGWDFDGRPGWKDLASIPTPMLVFQTDESDGDVLRSARRLVRMSRIGAASNVNASTRTSHLDPLVDLPARNLLLKPLVRVLAPGPTR